MMYWVIARTDAVVVAVHVVEEPIRVQFVAALSPVGMHDVVIATWHGLIPTVMMAVTVNMDVGR